ncbi:MAG: HEAT repeat domain-containing protein [Planctomycetes bacterium]|nr:HEAT repeat domain-containing protein [Planctomycetota bacterium]
MRAPGGAFLVPVLTAALLAASCSLLPEREPEAPSSREAWLDLLLAAEDARDPGSPTLTQAIAREDPVVRRFAYRALGRAGGLEAVRPILAALVREPLVELRAEGLFALGLTHHSSVVDAAERFLLDPNDSVRAAAVTALGLAGDDRGLITLLEALRDASPQVRSDAALSLGRLAASREDPLAGRPIAVFLVLGEALRRDPDARVRWAAAYAAGRLRREEMRPFLAEALGDGDARVRVFACEGLGLLPPEAASREGLIRCLADGDWTVVVEAVKALKADPSEEVFAALAPLLAGKGRAGHASLHVRAAAAEALSPFLGMNGCRPALLAALADSAESVRGAALEALASPDDPEQAAALLEDALAGKTAAQPTRYLQSRAARAAGLLPWELGWPIVEQLLRDPEVAVRSTALGALGQFKDAPAAPEPALRQALAEKDPALREAAASAAGALELAGLLPDLTRALDESAGADFVEARVSLLRALARAGKEEAVAWLRDYLDDEEAAVREAARDELARLGGMIPALPRPPPPRRGVLPRAGRDFATGRPNPVVKLVTGKGPFALELQADEAPHHAAAFLERCRAGFYDGFTFHRMVPGFVVQGLDPRGDGYGTGGFSLRGEVNTLRYERGSVGMPDAGPDTGGCQIFITFRPQPRLDARYTIFARVVEGMEIVEQLDVGDRVEYVVVPAE